MSPTVSPTVTSSKAPVVKCAKQSSTLNDMTSSKKSAIEEVRQSVLDEASTHMQDFYESDLSRVRTSDWQVKRFIVKARSTSGEKNAVSKAKDDMIQNLMWRKDVRLMERTESSFPDDFFRAGLIGAADCPATGKKVIYINTKVYRKVSELTEHFYAFGHTFLDRLDRQADGKRFTLFLDLSHLELANADVHFLRYYMELMMYRFPLMLEQTIIYEPPWYIKPFISVVFKVFPKSMLKNVSLMDRKGAIEQLGLDSIPEGAGGHLCTSIPIPESVPSYTAFAEEHGIPIEAMETARREYHLN